MADLEFAFKTKATITDRKTGAVRPKVLPIFDAKRNPMTENVWGGSAIKVAFEYMPYYNAATKTGGVSLRINAVQVLELVSSSGGSASNFGFGEPAGGQQSNRQVAPPARVPQDRISPHKRQFSKWSLGFILSSAKSTGARNTSAR